MNRRRTPLAGRERFADVLAASLPVLVIVGALIALAL